MNYVNRAEYVKQRGRHDRWSLEGARRRVTFAFLCHGQASDDPTKRRAYTIGANTGAYFGEFTDVIVTPQAAGLYVGRIMARVHNPVSGQLLFVDTLRIGNLEVLVEQVPLPMFERAAGVDLDPVPIQPGESIRLRLSCELGWWMNRNKRYKAAF